MPWPAVALGVGIIVGLLAYFTLYLPAQEPHANKVRLGALTASLVAVPHAGAAPVQGIRMVDLDLRLSGAVDDVSGVEIAANMPAMGNMAGHVDGLTQLGPGRYAAVAGLDMGGLWQIRASIHQPHGQPLVATFDVRV